MDFFLFLSLSADLMSLKANLFKSNYLNIYHGHSGQTKLKQYIMMTPM